MTHFRPPETKKPREVRRDLRGDAKPKKGQTKATAAEYRSGLRLLQLAMNKVPRPANRRCGRASKMTADGQIRTCPGIRMAARGQPHR